MEGVQACVLVCVDVCEHASARVERLGALDGAALDALEILACALGIVASDFDGR